MGVVWVEFVTTSISLVATSTKKKSVEVRITAMLIELGENTVIDLAQQQLNAHVQTIGVKT